MIVVGTVWVIVFNADVLLGGVMQVLGRYVRSRPSCACRSPTRSGPAFRTGTTLAMFTLVVFTLVTGSASNGLLRAAIDVDDFGGGFQVARGRSAPARSRT